jgi:hypothetical protein
MFHKAQTLSYDFFISASIFMAILTVILFYFSYSTSQISDTIVKNEISNKLFLASQIWFNEGYPKYWDESNVIQLGLANDGYLNNTKINKLNSIGYQKVLELIGASGYNVYYRVFDSANSTKFEFGLYPYNSKNTVKIYRTSILNGSLVTIETMVWK